MEEDVEYDIPIGCYRLRRLIGKGAFSSVWLADKDNSDAISAVKVIQKKTIENPELFTRFKREIALLEQLNHPFITHFYELFEDTKNYYVFLEYADNGDFGSFLNERSCLPENMCRYFITQIVLALDYLHNTCRIAHRDLKPENILLDRYNNIRITDFGLSNTFSEINPILTSNCGSPAYVAPEIVQGKSYTKAADIWSLGVILYRMATGELPFKGNDIQTVLYKTISAEPHYPVTIPPGLIDLIKRMLCKNPDERISVQEIMKHQWLCPSFVDAVYKSIEQLNQSIPTDKLQPDYVEKIVEVRYNLVYDINNMMNTVRQYLPPTSYHQPPHSLPSPLIDASISQLYTDDESSSERSQKVVKKKSKIPSSPSTTDIRKKGSSFRSSSVKVTALNSSSHQLSKKRYPIRIPSMLL